MERGRFNDFYAFAPTGFTIQTYLRFCCADHFKLQVPFLRERVSILTPVMKRAAYEGAIWGSIQRHRMV